MKVSMRLAIFMLAAGLLVVGVAIPQNLPPEVLLLSRIKNNIKEQLQRLPDISCLETVMREYRPATGKMRTLDTIRLEVLTNGSKELYASPGDRRFSERHPISYAGSGVLGDGFFGLYLKDILVTSSASIEYKGEDEIGGRRLARYDYRLPRMWSGQIIDIPEGTGQVGLRGSYWADPQTYDVVWLELNADDIPPTLPITKAVTKIYYARSHLGDDLVVLLPEFGEFHMVKYSGEISRNRIEFTNCRVFAVHSAINYGTPNSVERTPHFGASSVDDTLRSLPARLQIVVKLRSRISADTAVGSLIDGEVAANVPSKGAVIVAAGSPVRGRIRRLEHYSEPFSHFVVALEFTEVELLGIRYRFYADLMQVESAPGVEQTLSTRKRAIWNLGLDSSSREFEEARETLWLHNLPGVATFFYKGGTLDLPPGLRTLWKTRPVTP